MGKLKMASGAWKDSPLNIKNMGWTKGQLISKCPYEKSVWTKYQRKYF